MGARATADAIRDLKTCLGIDVPLARITRKQALARKPGFIGHGETDPTRRSDPGPDFPWFRFLAMVRDELNGPATTTPARPAPTTDEDLEVLMRYPFILRDTKTTAWTLVLSPSKQVALPKLTAAEAKSLTDAFGEPVSLTPDVVARVKKEIG